MRTIYLTSRFKIEATGKIEEWCIQYVKSEETGGTEQW